MGDPQNPPVEREAPEPDDDFLCEGCGKVIAKGDKYTVTLDGCYLCEEDAPSFQDAVDYWNHHEPDDREEHIAKHDCQNALDEHVAEGGSPDDKPLFVMQ